MTLPQNGRPRAGQVTTSWGRLDFHARLLGGTNLRCGSGNQLPGSERVEPWARVITKQARAGAVVDHYTRRTGGVHVIDEPTHAAISVTAKLRGRAVIKACAGEETVLVQSSEHR